jgi:hypothetical protein
MSELVLDKSEFPELQNCKVGDVYTLTGTATDVSGNELTLDITEAVPAEDEGAGEEASTGEESDMPMKGKSPVAAIGVPMRGKTYA